jgi:hypothetical protein
MSTSRWLAVVAVVTSVAALSPRSMHAQKLPVSAIALTSKPTLKSFAPVDSFFPNPSATSFNIALVNSVSGAVTDYRVSRFADFRDAAWRPYSAKPILLVPRAWFPQTVNGVAQITLYLQVRTKNPNGGRPAALADGKLTVQPDFFFSEVIGRRIRLAYFG